MRKHFHILLYNPISGHGHLDSLNCMYAKLFLQLGYELTCLTPNKQILCKELKVHNLEDISKLNIYELQNTEKIKPSIIYPIHLWWYNVTNTYVNRLPESMITDDMLLKQRFKKRIALLIVPPSYKVFDFLRRYISRIFPKKTNSQQDTDAGLLDPGIWGRQLKEIIKKARRKPDFIFNMYMDMYSLKNEKWKAFAKNCSLPWAGIRFAPNPSSDEPYYKLGNLCGMCFLQKEMDEIYRKKFPNKIFTPLPDITNDALPDEEPELVVNIKHMAQGRTIVFLGGSLDTRKNIAMFAELVKKSTSNEYFFVLCGRVYIDSFSAEDTAALEYLQSNPCNHIYIYSDFLPDEKIFNSVINASDIVFAVYKGFPYSSNMVSKAAKFKKFILVPTGGEMELVVTKYKLGIAVPELDIDAAWKGLQLLHQKIADEPDYTGYNTDFNEVKMKKILELFVNKCLLG